MLIDFLFLIPYYKSIIIIKTIIEVEGEYKICCLSGSTKFINICVYIFLIKDKTLILQEI